MPFSNHSCFYRNEAGTSSLYEEDLKILQTPTINLTFCADEKIENLEKNTQP